MSNSIYPAVRICVRHGNAIALTVSFIVALLGLAAGLAGVMAAFAAIPVAAVLYCILRLLIEIVQIISTTLLPE